MKVFDCRNCTNIICEDRLHCRAACTANPTRKFNPQWLFSFIPKCCENSPWSPIGGRIHGGRIHGGRIHGGRIQRTMVSQDHVKACAVNRRVDYWLWHFHSPTSSFRMPSASKGNRLRIVFHFGAKTAEDIDLIVGTVSRSRVHERDEHEESNERKAQNFNDHHVHHFRLATDFVLSKSYHRHFLHTNSDHVQTLYTLFPSHRHGRRQLSMRSLYDWALLDCTSPILLSRQSCAARRLFLLLGMQGTGMVYPLRSPRESQQLSAHEHCYMRPCTHRPEKRAIRYVRGQRTTLRVTPVLAKVGIAEPL